MRDRDRGGRRPGAVVWRSTWLPPSETFVADHVRALRRYRAIPLGLHRTKQQPLDVRPLRAPFGSDRWGTWALTVSARTGYAGVYDRFLRAGHARVVHAHFGMDAIQALPLARRHRLPLVVTFHGWDVLQLPQEDATGWYARRLPEVFAYASALLPVSAYLAERLAELGAPRATTRVHHLGIPLPDRLPDPGAPREGIAFVGRLVPLKGAGDLIEAVRLLPPALRATPVRILGDGPERAALERAAAAIPGADIAFEGRVAPERVAQALARARVFAGPSTVTGGRPEAFGLTFLEAARAGAPVVGYANGGIPEAVDDGRTGVLVPDHDVPALAEALARLLVDDDLAIRLGRAGQERVRARFDLAGRTALLEELYDECVAAGPGVGITSRPGVGRTGVGLDLADPGAGRTSPGDDAGPGGVGGAN